MHVCGLIAMPPCARSLSLFLSSRSVHRRDTPRVYTRASARCVRVRVLAAGIREAARRGFARSRALYVHTSHRHVGERGEVEETTW